METTDLIVPALGSERDQVDVGNVLTSLKGVGDLRFDLPSHAVTVEYDADYTSPPDLRRTVTEAGYPVEEPVA